MFATRFASIFSETLAVLLLTIPLGLFLVGTGTITVWGVLFGILAVILAFILDSFISLSIGLVAFWTEDARPYQWIYGKFLFVLGGLMFPLEIFPTWLQTIAKLLPPAYLMYYPARLFVDFSWELLLRALIGQIVYITVFGIAAYVIYKSAIRKVSINGG